MQTPIECALCATTTWADTRALEPVAEQTAPGTLDFIVHCEGCGRPYLVQQSRASWEKETGRAATPTRPARDADAGRDEDVSAGAPESVATPEPAAAVPIVEGVMRPGEGAAYGARQFDYLCPHCGAVTGIDGQNYDLLTFYRRGGAAAAFQLPDAFAPFAARTRELIAQETGDDFLAFRCTGCAAPVVAVLSSEAQTHPGGLYRVERVYELRSWSPPRAGARRDSV